MARCRFIKTASWGVFFVSKGNLFDGSHLENLFFASSPEPKGQLTPNLLGSIGVTCRSKITKIVPIVRGHLENLFFASSPNPKCQLTRNLVGSIRVIVDQK